MTSAEIAAWAQALAGIATFGAAAMAVRAAYDAPKKAAEFAEALRAQNSLKEGARRMQVDLLLVLMRNRRKSLYVDVYEYLNMIDAVFIDSKDVREAWHQFYFAVTDEHSSADLRAARYNKIIEEIIRYLGLSEGISATNIEIAYVPMLADRELMNHLHRVDKEWLSWNPQSPSLHGPGLGGQVKK